MDWLVSNGLIGAALITGSVSLIHLFWKQRGEDARAKRQREESKDPFLASQKEKARALLNHKTRIEHRIETLARSFPELTKSMTRRLLRTVGAEPFRRRNGVETWYLKEHHAALINRRRAKEAKQREPWQPN